MARTPPELDRIDQRIIHALMVDARNNTAPSIAEKIDVSPGTVRNRIARLADDGIIEGYHAHVNFERTEGRLTALFMCNVPFADRQTAAQASYSIPGVINIRILMGGRRNFHVLAVGEDTADLRRIGTTLSEGGIDIEDEMLLEQERLRAYEPFGPTNGVPPELTTAIQHTPPAEITGIEVHPDAPVTNHTISEAVSEGLLDDEPLIVAIRRDDELVTPHGDTTLYPHDTVTLYSATGLTETTLDAFTKHAPSPDS